MNPINFIPEYKVYPEIFTTIHKSILNTYSSSEDIKILQVKELGSHVLCSFNFNIDNTNIDGSFYIVKNTNQILNEFHLKFDNIENIHQKLNINKNHIDDIINSFIDTSVKFKTIHKSEINHIKIIDSQKINDAGYYSFPFVYSHTVFYNEGYKQRKSVKKKPTNTSYISQKIKFKLNSDNFMIEAYLELTLPFLYKNKLSFEFKMKDNLDLEGIEKLFSDTYNLKIKNHFKNVLKIKSENFDVKYLDYYSSLVSMQNY